MEKTRKLAMPLLGMLLWVLYIHAGTFAAATLLPRPITGIGKSIYFHQGREAHDLPLPPLPIQITEKDLNRSVVFGRGVVSRMQRLETNLGWSNINVKKGTPSHGQLIVSSPEQEALRQGREALIATKATIHLMNSFCNKHKVDPINCSKYVSSFSLKNTPMEASCGHTERSCNAEETLSPYRSIDGSCNHKSSGAKGAAFTAYQRLLYPEYLDGVQEPRRAISKSLLPSARYIHTSVLKTTDGVHSDLTLALMQWSQFIEHDLSHTVSSKMVHTDNTIECCAETGSNLSPRYVHPFCAPISVPFDDKYYARHGLDCMTYVRSVPALRSDCSFGPIDQVNQATHYLDGSQIYGSTIAKALTLRSLSGGALAVTMERDRDFLPLSQNPTEDCQLKSNNSQCYVSGDSRVNVHPQLTAMHILWAREHNRIAKILAKINPKWDDEKLYQEARRIVIAEIQRITYEEWIPVVLGSVYHNKIAKYTNYQEFANPAISNSFATAAFRVINSLMDGKVKLYKENRLVNSSLNLRSYFNKPDIVEEPGYFDAIVRGLATQTTQKLNHRFVEDISSQLFSNGDYGFDIFSLDIQRGRDHGLPSYTSFRKLCGLNDVKSFEDFSDVMPEDVIKSIESVYKSPHDVDLIVGGMSERPAGDSLFGPTLSCIIADQFLRTRRGDRYFYTNDIQPLPLSKAQRREIEKVSLARIFCDNSDNIEQMQRNVFKKVDESNSLQNCEELPRMDLMVWLDQRDLYY